MDPLEYLKATYAIIQCLVIFGPQAIVARFLYWT